MARCGEPEPLRPDDPGRIGPYRLLGRLGQGGMGTVYLAEGPGGERVAVKVINPELAGEGDALRRFRREVAAARRVRRYCTAPLIDADLDRRPPYLVTEYIDGPSLDRAVAERGPLAGSALEGLAVGVATALAGIHRAGIVHRDLKPANVLLSPTGPRVIDFGIARPLDEPGGPTRSGQFVGTPSYMAPEVLLGEPAGRASDVFAWGCVVAFAGTGRPPFRGRTTAETFHHIQTREPVMDGLDPELRGLALATLAKDPRDRPSAGELLDQLVGDVRPDDPATLEATVRADWTEERTPAPAVPPAPPASAQPNRRSLLPGAVSAAVVVAVAAGALIARGVGTGPDTGPSGDVTRVWGDDFTDTNGGWPGGLNHTAGEEKGSGYGSGDYLVDSGTTDANWVPAPLDIAKIPARALVTVKVSGQGPPGKGWYGVDCRAVADTPGMTGRRYAFTVREDGRRAVLTKASPEQGVQELAESGPIRSLKQANKVQITCEDENGGRKVRLRLWVNGHRLIDATDARGPLGPGRIGLEAAPGGGDVPAMSAAFDDLAVCEIG
ncbi:serine/threonine-protein kinase [Actinomadura opuntiae]|uniref:serine/threonine-protein kinase n=1 Tax=Actinomadura sp. OS1-43 TaxID=604315 RepID=UPI00255B1971|nr:serine/threonine-protein kinase [Actinomadura sp. OS1-43]MDL4818234.1 serine/threonine-protein kinase [Actinomadura sp. OS1-43]